MRKVDDEIETHPSSETVLIVKTDFDVDDCLKSENSAGGITQSVKVLHCFCDLRAFGYGTVCELRHVCGSEIHFSFVLEKPQVARRSEICTATAAVILAKLVANKLE